MLEFAINTAEDFKKSVKKTKAACTEFFRRILITYNRCQIEAEQRLEAFPDHNTFVELLRRDNRKRKLKYNRLKP